MAPQNKSIPRGGNMSKNLSTSSTSGAQGENVNGGNIIFNEQDL